MLAAMGIVIGCGGPKKLQQYTELSGTVRFKGKPVTGGSISFFGKEGEAAKTAPIKPDGTYTVQAPVGDVTISVDNSMLKPGFKKVEKRPGQGQGAGPRPGMGEQTEITGTYVDIPAKYYKPETSGLKHTVKKGEATYDIELPDN
jgi:hypothetical protein